MEKKKWYLSRLVWVGFVGFVGGILQATGVIEAPFSADTQLLILGVIVFILRLVTKEPIAW